jgi:hypothetical protein
VTLERRLKVSASSDGSGGSMFDEGSTVRIKGGLEACKFVSVVAVGTEGTVGTLLVIRAKKLRMLLEVVMSTMTSSNTCVSDFSGKSWSCAVSSTACSVSMAVALDVVGT